MTPGQSIVLEWFCQTPSLIVKFLLAKVYRSVHLIRKLTDLYTMGFDR